MIRLKRDLLALHLSPRTAARIQPVIELRTATTEGDQLSGGTLQARLWYEEGVNGRNDLGARLGPTATAFIGVTTRGVRASHTHTHTHTHTH